MGRGMSSRFYYFVGLLLCVTQAELSAQSAPDLVQQIAVLMAQGPSGKAHQRFVHAKV